MPTPRPDAIPIPDELRAALADNPRAQRAFDAMSPSHRREYAAHVAEAKQAATRVRRAGKCVALMLDGQQRKG